MKIVVTGATGMVGKACIRRFIKRGDEVVALARRPFVWTGEPDVWLTNRTTDYSRDDLRRALHGVEAIVHLAAMRPNAQADAIGYRPYFEANVQTTENLLLAAGDEGITKCCLASSISVYSEHNRMPYREADCPWPSSYYGVSKVACEHLALLYASRSAMKVVALRIAQILGNDDTYKNKMLMQFIALARRKQYLTLWGEGADARDTVYLNDVVSAFVLALDHDVSSGVFNIGGGRAFSNREVAETINEVFDNVGHLTFDRSRAEENRYFFMDCSKAEQELGWRRQWTLRTALQDMRRQRCEVAVTGLESSGECGFLT